MNKVNQPETFLRLRDTPDQYAPLGSNVVSTGDGVGYVTPTTVSALPTPGSTLLGAISIVTDASGATAWGATVSGGGSLKCLVWCDGANWTVLGK